MLNHFIPQNSVHPRCVDGRKAVAFVEWDGEKWVVSKKGEEAEAECGPQFLGGSLLFVKVLEDVAGHDRETAFDLVEKASEKLGWGLQIHVDDHHGAHYVLGMSDEEILSLMNVHHTGCGFSKYAWGEEGEALIASAKDRHWRVQILAGHHNESGAFVNYCCGHTCHTANRVNANEAAFNTDFADAELMFVALAPEVKDKSFVEKALAWTKKTYQDVVVALGGVKHPDEIEENRD